MLTFVRFKFLKVQCTMPENGNSFIYTSFKSIVLIVKFTRKPCKVVQIINIGYLINKTYSSTIKINYLFEEITRNNVSVKQNLVHYIATRWQHNGQMKCALFDDCFFLLTSIVTFKVSVLLLW